jgi:hypothetical protein
MAFYPRIQMQCPYKSNLASMMEGDMCGICKTQVVDMSAWSDDEGRAFVANRKEATCITYRMPLRPALAAAALAVAALPTMAAAQQASPPPPAEAQAPADDPESAEIVGVMIVLGGINDPANVEFLSAEELAAVPEAPVAYEDEAPAPPPAAKPGT